MAKKVKKKDYLYTSARAWAMEHSLLSRNQMDGMVKAESPADAARVLTECGYPEFPSVTPGAIDAAIQGEREKTYALFGSIAPEPLIVDVFRAKYDYHNAKVLLKAARMGESGQHLLSNLGRVPPKKLADGMLHSDLQGVPPILQTAIRTAQETLRTTNDPQRSDLVLDQAYFEDLANLARRSNSSFLEGYVRLSIDASNLRSAVRAMRMKKRPEFLRNILFPGGNVDPARIARTITAGSALDTLFAVSPLKEAAEEGGLAAKGERPPTRFEKLCDDAVSRYLQGAKYHSISEAPLIRYLGAKETEFTAVRIIMIGLLSGLTPEVLWERLRDVYV